MPVDDVWEILVYDECLVVDVLDDEQIIVFLLDDDDELDEIDIVEFLVLDELDEYEYVDIDEDEEIEIGRASCRERV